MNALLKDGELLYRNGEWIGGHETDKIRVGTSEYIVTTDKPDGGLSNPFVESMKVNEPYAYTGLDDSWVD